MVGPRWPVLAAANSVRPSRGSSCTWLMLWPRKCGPSATQVLRSGVAVEQPRALARGHEDEQALARAAVVLRFT